MTILYYFQP